MRSMMSLLALVLACSGDRGGQDMTRDIITQRTRRQILSRSKMGQTATGRNRRVIRNG